ncbi:MAG: ATP-grasp domain-containing protein [Candidatus Woesearchaeota archaeon]
MKAVILHENIEWAELQFSKELQNRGIECTLHDIRDLDEGKIKELLDMNPDLVLNRVYPSVAYRNYHNNIKALALMKEFENNDIFCVNSYQTTKADYSKHKSASIMENNGVSTPKTLYFSKYEYDIGKIEDFVALHGFPLIMKRDIGGRGRDITLIESKEQLYRQVIRVLLEVQSDNYEAGYVLQEFIHPVRNHDCRIAIIDGKFVFSYGRTLIPRPGFSESPWLASVSNGSQIISYSPSEEEIELAIKATSAIGALFNEVDMTFSSKGPTIIENNPSPNYDPGEEELIDKAVSLILAKIGDKVVLRHD